MKNLLIVLVGLLVANTAFSSSLICNGGYGFDGAGTVMSNTDNKCYIMVKAGAAFVDGDVVTQDYTGDGGHTVTPTTTAALRPHCVFDASCASGAVCKCQVYGKHDAVKIDVTNHTVTVGFGLATSGTAKQAEGKPSAERGGFATALDTSATSGTVEAFIHLL